MSETIASLTGRFPRAGKLEWIGVRPARRQPVIALPFADVTVNGLDGDRRNRPGKRAVTLIQAEHLPVIAALAGLDAVDPAALRRNLVVSGISLAALRGMTFRIGGAVLRGTDVCAPCSRMEEALGPGGYNAMRGHGGITAEVVEAGRIALSDTLSVLPATGRHIDVTFSG